MTETRSTLGIAVDQCIDGLQAQLKILRDRISYQAETIGSLRGQRDRSIADAERLAGEVRELKETNALLARLNDRLMNP